MKQKKIFALFLAGMMVSSTVPAMAADAVKPINLYSSDIITMSQQQGQKKIAAPPGKAVTSIDPSLKENLMDLVSGIKRSEDLEKEGFMKFSPVSQADLQAGDIAVVDGKLYVLAGGTSALSIPAEEGTEAAEVQMFFSNLAQYYRREPTAPEYAIPEGLTAPQGTTLSDIVLPDGFAWKEPDTVLEEQGEHEFHATFTPSNTLKYFTVDDVTVTVSVTKPLRELQMPESTYSLPYYPGLRLSAIKLPEGWHFEDPSMILDVGETDVTALFDADPQYEYTHSTDPVTVRVSVKKSRIDIGSVEISVPSGTMLTDGLLPVFDSGYLVWDQVSQVAAASADYSCHFVPYDTAHYSVTQNIMVHVAVTAPLPQDPPAVDPDPDPGTGTDPGQQDPPAVDPEPQPSQPENDPLPGDNGDGGKDLPEIEINSSKKPEANSGGSNSGSGQNQSGANGSAGESGSQKPSSSGSAGLSLRDLSLMTLEQTVNKAGRTDSDTPKVTTLKVTDTVKRENADEVKVASADETGNAAEANTEDTAESKTKDAKADEKKQADSKDKEDGKKDSKVKSGLKSRDKEKEKSDEADGKSQKSLSMKTVGVAAALGTLCIVFIILAVKMHGKHKIKNHEE